MREKRSWLRRLLHGLVLMLLVPEAAYLVAANSFLASAWGRARMNRHPERLRLEYEGASTWIPGRVRVRGLELQGGSPRSRWRVAVDAFELRIALAPLVRREFRLAGAAAEGAEIEVDLLPRPEAAPLPKR